MSFAKLAAAVIAPEPTDEEEDQPTKSLNRKMLLGSILGLGGLAGGGYLAYKAMNPPPGEPITWGQRFKAMGNVLKDTAANAYESYIPAAAAAVAPLQWFGKAPYVGRLIHRLGGGGFGDLDLNFSDLRKRMDQVREGMPKLEGVKGVISKNISGKLYPLRRLLMGDESKAKDINLKPSAAIENDPVKLREFIRKAEAQQASAGSLKGKFEQLHGGIGNALDPKFKDELFNLISGKMKLVEDKQKKLVPKFTATYDPNASRSLFRHAQNANELASVDPTLHSPELRKILADYKKLYGHDIGTVGGMLRDYTKGSSGNFGLKRTAVRAGIGASIAPLIRYFTGE